MRSPCEWIQPRLGEYLAGELEADEAALLRAHLVECGDCRLEEESLKGLLEVLAVDAGADGLGAISDPGPRYWAELAGRVSEACAREKPSRLTHSRWAGWLSPPRLVLAGSFSILIGLLAAGPLTPARDRDDDESLLLDLYEDSLDLDDLDGMSEDDLGRLLKKLDGSKT